MTKGKKALRGIGITLLVLLILAAITLGIVFAILSGGNNPGGEVIEYSYLKTVMQDDVVYLADEFMSENNLSFDVGEDDLYYDVENAVYLAINRRKVHNNDFTKRVENIDGYSYSLVNNSEESMPISVSVRGIAGKDDNIKTKCNNKTVDGYKYGMSYSGELIYSNSGIYKEIVVRTTGNKSLINKKNCILTVSVSIGSEDAQNYTDDEIITKFDEVLNSALAHIERYGE